MGASDSTTTHSEFSFDSTHEVGKFVVPYKISNAMHTKSTDVEIDEIDGIEWSEYMRMFNSIEWNGKIPDSFKNLNKNDEIYELVIKIKNETDNKPSRIRTKQQFIRKLKIDINFFNKYEQFINKHLNLSQEITLIQQNKNNLFANNTEENINNNIHKTDPIKPKSSYWCFSLQRESI